MVYSDNQTKHFYVLDSNATVTKKALDGKNLFRVVINANGETVTSDVIDSTLIKDVRVSKPTGINTRKWILKANNIEANKKYKLYFYVENLYGFGLQDRWDIVASYTPSTTTAADFYAGLADDLNLKLNGAGPMKGDFTVTSSANGVEIVENPKKAGELDLRVLHNFPYQYDVLISGLEGDSNLWLTDGKYAKTYTYSVGYNGVKIYDMEHYFTRNRADLYDVTPDFYTSIVNPSNAKLDGTYYVIDIHYSFKDEGSFDYSSDKDLAIACTSLTQVNSVLSTLGLTSDAKKATSFVGPIVIDSEESWKANKASLADYYAYEIAAGRTPANYTEWNGDGWVVFNMTRNNAGTFKYKYDNGEEMSVDQTANSTYVIASITDPADKINTTIADFDLTKLTYTIA